jgi:hypothetical protein
MAVRRPKRPRRDSSKPSNPPSDNPEPSHSISSATPADLRPTTIVCEPWIARRPGSQAIHSSAPVPLLVLPGQQRFTQNIRPSLGLRRVEDNESNSRSPIAVINDPRDSDPFVDEPLFSDSLYMPDGPVDLSRPRLSGLQKKQNQWRRWSEEVIPSLITSYLAYIRRSVSLQCAPDLHPSSGDNSHCNSFCRPRSLAVTCVLFDRAFCVF